MIAPFRAPSQKSPPKAAAVIPPDMAPIPALTAPSASTPFIKPTGSYERLIAPETQPDKRPDPNPINMLFPSHPDIIPAPNVLVTALHVS